MPDFLAIRAMTRGDAPLVNGRSVNKGHEQMRGFLNLPQDVYLAWLRDTDLGDWIMQHKWVRPNQRRAGKKVTLTKPNARRLPN